MIILCDGCGKKFDNGSLICPFCGEGHMEYYDTYPDREDQADIQEALWESIPTGEHEIQGFNEDSIDMLFTDADILLEQDIH